MRTSLALALVAALALATAALPPQAAETNTVKIGDLAKEGYSCKEVGEARHLCTRDKSPTYGCEEWECKPIGRVLGGQGVRAPTGGLLRR